MAETVMIPLLLVCQKRRCKHRKNLELIVSEMPPIGQTVKPELLRGQSIIRTGLDQIELPRTPIQPAPTTKREEIAAA